MHVCIPLKQLHAFSHAYVATLTKQSTYVAM